VDGLKIHLAGSAARDCSPALLTAAHELVRALVGEIVAGGGGLVLGAGAEPQGEAALPCIFDWTALEGVAECPDPAPNWPSLRPDRFVVVSSHSGIEQIPGDRRELWSRVQRRTDIEQIVTPPGWRMASLIRQRQVRRGDVLIVLGGGAGVEQLAQTYAFEGKPVVPIGSNLGSFSRDGSGGSQFLHERAISHPADFIQLSPGKSNAAGRLLALRLDENTDVAVLAKKVGNLVRDLQDPKVFYVRLLDTSSDDFQSVEGFFRTVVDQVMCEKGLTPDEMGRRTPTTAFMNLDIFQSIHAARVVVVDLTGVRPNCMMELGYALGLGKRTILTAREATHSPFDPDKIPTHFWSASASTSERSRIFGEWFDQYLEIPRIIDDEL
jgi:hypothetical protein